MNTDWSRVTSELDAEGQTIVPGLFSAAECAALAALYTNEIATGPALSLADVGLGRGTVKPFRHTLPEPLGRLREVLYEQLLPLARRWELDLGGSQRWPDDYATFRSACREAAQTHSASGMIHLASGEHLGLHQDVAAEPSFPVQVVLLLSEPGSDFTGGELVMTEQRPRMQSRPMVVPARRGDVALLTARHRPVAGARGFYRVSLKRAVSRVIRGERLAIDLLLHGAP
jgi:uncharacterized protein